MAITVNWVTGVVSVPKADTTLAGTDPISGRELRNLDTDLFHVNLRIAEDTTEGRSWPVTHDYNKDATFGGSTYAPQFILKNSYQVEFEDGTYRVIFTNTNNNIADFSVINGVSIQPGNTAGLQRVISGSGVEPADITAFVAAMFARIMENGETFEEAQRLMRAESVGKVVKNPDGSYNFLSADGVTTRFTTEGNVDNGRDITNVDGT